MLNLRDPFAPVANTVYVVGDELGISKTKDSQNCPGISRWRGATGL
jgi:hypothetical protein